MKELNIRTVPCTNHVIYNYCPSSSIFRLGGTRMKKTVKVVAAVIENEENELLCALRSQDMSIPNMWEFPGGKVEKDEDVHTALKREIEEELSCQIETQ